MPLHLDYRPKDLNEIVGNESIKTSLKSLLTREDRPHVYLLHGSKGTGKTTLAKILAVEWGCDANHDLKEMNISNTRGVDTAREIIQNAQYAPLSGPVKVYILNECHKATPEFQNAMLDILEFTPKHVYFILVTTEPEKIIGTVRDRCTTYQTMLLTDIQMKKLLNWVLEKEKVENFPEKVLKEIIRVSEGGPRQALVVLDSVIDILDEKEALEAVSVVTIGEAEVIEICRAIMDKQSWKALKVKVKDVLSRNEPEKLRYAILGYLTAIMLNRDSNDRISELIDVFSESTYTSGKAGICNMIYLSCK